MPDEASAACEWVRTEQMVSGTIRIKWERRCDSASESSSIGYVAPPRDSDWDRVCVRSALEIDADPGRYCDLPPEGGAAPTVTPGSIARAFRRIPLPEAKLVIQPPNGRTLVNFETNFYTEQGEFTRAVTLLGQRVELRIWPASFGWRYGDGESERTTSPGAAYPDLEVTHTYLRKGRVSPSVDTTYAAEFRVGGGPWRDVAGTVTIPGTPQQLRVVEARPVLVGG
ncbi:hypothetical protein GCM10023349_00530 [Nocardioides conyzicola]|uniref:PKD domain-containing protein n=1 Tax=Nocardioides conyzicola TaxID=1651781 RepID=A0ABP8WKM2_9ACTN